MVAVLQSDQDMIQNSEKVASAVKSEEKSRPNPRTPPEVVQGVGDSSMPRKKLKGGEKWDVSSGKESVVGEKEPEITKTEEEKEVELELSSLLKRSPSMHLLILKAFHNSRVTLTENLVIIFSKSGCPYSKKAKATFGKYTIIPEPFIVELDQHKLGHQLQDTLEKNTGRRTVPNILISGKSIGGGDEVEVLHQSGSLIEKIKYMGGKRIMEAKLKDS